MDIARQFGPTGFTEFGVDVVTVARIGVEVESGDARSGDGDVEPVAAEREAVAGPEVDAPGSEPGEVDVDGAQGVEPAELGRRRVVIAGEQVAEFRVRHRAPVAPVHDVLPGHRLDGVLDFHVPNVHGEAEARHP